MTGFCTRRSSCRLLLALLMCCAALQVSAEGAELADATDAAATAATADTLVIPLDRFLTKPQIRDLTLSPDGTRIAYLLRESYGASVGLVDLRRDADGTAMQRVGSRLAESLYWSTDSSGLFVETQDRLAWLPAAETRPHWIYDLTSDPISGARTGVTSTVLGVDPMAPHHMLVAQELERGQHRLLRVDAQAEVEVLLESEHPVSSVLLDRSSASSAARRAVRYVRQPHDGPSGLGLTIWRLAEVGDLSTGQEVLRCGNLDPCVPVAYEALEPVTEGRRERLWVRGSAAESLTHLYSVDVSVPGDGGELTVSAPQHVHGDPQGLADLESLTLDRKTGLPLLVTYDSDFHRLFGLDDTSERTLARLRQRFPKARLAIELSTDGPNWLVEERGARLAHPRHYLYDVEGDSLQPILHAQRERGGALPEGSLVEPQNISWQASDGLTVHGLLWLPRGVDARHAPMVVRMHGGPWNHVRRQWSVVSQFLANRSYIVFEPNFRSSTGFGRDYILAAQGDFGDGRVQQDMLDGLDHLHRQGIGAADRVAIMGHSFGGFSTLGAMAFTPKRFVVGVASAPPINLVRALRDLSDDHRIGNGLIQKQVILPLVGDLDDPQVVAALRRQSPEARLADTERPLLIFAGGADPKVDIVDVRHYASALQQLGLDVSLIVDEEQGHSFEHEVSIGAYLYLLERFLGHHLGGTMGPVDDPRITAYLETRVLLSGPSLGAAVEGQF